MTQTGKRLRLRRLLGSDGRGVIIPIDHGVSAGPMPGVERPADTARAMLEGRADSLVLHKGLVPAIAGQIGGMGLWLHVSASTSLNPDGNDKRVVATPLEALELGCEGLSLHVNVGALTESDMIEDMGRLTTECGRLGLPVLAMMYPRGPDIRNPNDVDLVKNVARVGWELGADVLKVPYTGSPETFREVTRSVGAPVLIAGGPRADTPREFLAMVAGSLEGGGAGISVGRNLWQARDPAALTRAVARLVHDRASLEDVLNEVGKAQ